MLYTLSKGLAWFAVAFLLGVIVGWLMRNVSARRQIARARNHHVDTAEMERLRGRVANLEPLVSERDRLRAELDACAAKLTATRRPAAATLAAAAPAADAAATATAPSTAPTAAAVAGFATLDPDATPTPPAEVVAAPDVAIGSTVLGRKLVLDDLKAVEGIGPKIEALCHRIGIRTWLELSTTEVSLLRTMLADAGSRFAAHDPSTWPQQAGLLAAGRWEEFRQLTDRLQGGTDVAP